MVVSSVTTIVVKVSFISSSKFLSVTLLFLLVPINGRVSMPSPLIFARAPTDNPNMSLVISTLLKLVL